MLIMFDKQIQLRMGQANVRRCGGEPHSSIRPQCPGKA
jgi:hypothetical protein